MPTTSRLWRAVRRLKRSSQRTFTYLPLHNPTAEIRILELQPGANTDPIHCRLVRTHLPHQNQNPPIYEALSYTWGTDAASCSITISSNKDDDKNNGGTLAIRPNLLAALQRVRDRSTVRRLWVDALCINQSDIPERNAQVGIMLRIYQTAARVIVWLGPATDNSHLAMSPQGLLHNFHAFTVESWEAELSPSSERWEAFAYLQARPWWRRTWVIQEVVAAREVVVMCGAEELGWEQLAYNLALLGVTMLQLGDKAPMQVKDVSGVAVFRQQYRDALKEGGRPRPGLLETLSMFREWQATDARDKVYGLLGFATAAADNGGSDDGDVGAATTIPVDYHLSTKEVYEGVARHFMTTGSCFKIMGLVDPASSRRLPGLASWAPDWTVDLPFYPLRNATVYRPSASTEPLHYHLSSSSGAEPQFRFLDNPSRLCVQVRLLAEVGGGTLAPWPPFRDTKAGLREVEDLVVRMMQSLRWPFYPDETSTRAAFRRTLIVDTVDGKARASTEDLERYFDWFNLPDYEPENQASGVPALDASQGEVKKISAEEYSRILPELMAESAHNRDIHRDKTREQDDERFFDAIRRAGAGRDLFFELNGLIGMGLRGLRDGDYVCVPVGGDVPWLVRPVESGMYEFVGECYVHGIMDGETLISTERLCEIMLV